MNVKDIKTFLKKKKTKSTNMLRQWYRKLSEGEKGKKL